MCNILSRGNDLALDGQGTLAAYTNQCFCRRYNQEKHLIAKIRSGAVYWLFREIFDVVLAKNEEDVAEAHRLRYLVFCEENEGFEKPADNPGGLESDDFDRQADHVLLVYRATNMVVGTLRVIRPGADCWQEAFPMQRICDSGNLADKTFVMNACELSRLCISTTRRMLLREHLISRRHSGLERSKINLMMSLAPLGLIGGAFDLAVGNGFSNVLGVMRKTNIARLQRAGLVTRNLGPKVEYHGLRQPFMANIPETFANGLRHNSNAWIVASDYGRIHRAAMNSTRCQACFFATR